MYVVVEKGWEYNDEYYTEQGFSGIKKIFKRKKEAQELADDLNYHYVLNHGIAEFTPCDYLGDTRVSEDVVDFISSIGGSTNVDWYWTPFPKGTSKENILKGLKLLGVDFYEVLESD